MLQQTLTYYISGSAITLSNDNGVVQTYYNSTYEISGSEYETGPGGFKSTVATIRINIVSGSILLASFPYDETNLIINSSSAEFATSSDNITIQYTTYQTDNIFNPLYYFKIINSSSLQEIVNTAINPPENLSSTTANSSSKYIVELYSGDNKYNQINLYDATSSLLFASSYITGSGSIVLNLTGSSFYSINAIVSGSVCCAPTLNSIDNINYSQLQFNFSTGSCGTYTSMSVYQSADGNTWTLFYSGSGGNTIISPTGSYPLTTTFYKLISYCSEGYSSDSSNIIGVSPETAPSPSNPSASYTATLIGRIYSGSYSASVYYGTTPATAVTAAMSGDAWTTSYKTFSTFSIQYNQPLYLKSDITGLTTSSYGFGYNGPYNTYLTTTNSGSLYISNVVSDITVYINIKSGSL